MSLPTLPSTKYAWGAAVLVSSLSLTTPLLYWHHPWLYAGTNLLLAGLLALQMLLAHLPDIFKALGQMRLNISKGQSLLLNASPPIKRHRRKTPARKAPRAK
ncbi:hypothetical protein KLP40_14630 [Hymenobacter sp. NST-14]|uniref:hypothetical protein n=1 Tax=Hymenobacter piscis TaxID=2839984 RepID=UPI001C01DEB5|nr:hypothetical protein [Hymenobacter piscis]MBT9394404.1 hypothetical protein [Hymenobacter piscis]